jgi:hypothetical protein
LRLIGQKTEYMHVSGIGSVWLFCFCFAVAVGFCYFGGVGATGV